MSYVDLNKSSHNTFLNQGKLEVPVERDFYAQFVLGLKIIAESAQVESRLSIEELKVRMNLLHPSYIDAEEGAINECIQLYQVVGMTCFKIQKVCEELLRAPDNIRKDQVDSLHRLVMQGEDTILSHKRRIDEIRQNIYDFEQGGTIVKVPFNDIVTHPQQKIENRRTLNSELIAEGELLKEILKDSSAADIIFNMVDLPELDFEVVKAVIETVKRECIDNYILGMMNFFAKESAGSQGISVLDISQMTRNLENNNTIARGLLKGNITVEEAKAKVLPLSHMEVTAIKVHNLAMNFFSSMKF